VGAAARETQRPERALAQEWPQPALLRPALESDVLRRVQQQPEESRPERQQLERLEQLGPERRRRVPALRLLWRRACLAQEWLQPVQAQEHSR